MTELQKIITIAAVVAGTLLTRFLPFFLFPPQRKAPDFINYLGKVLPYAVIGLLVVFSMKDVAGSGTYGIPEALSILLIFLLHKWKKNTLLSIGAGTVFYMFLVQSLF